LVNCSIVFIRN